MTLPTLPPPSTPTMGPLPGESIATAGVISVSQYSEPFRLTSWFEDGVWLKWTAPQGGTVLIDSLLSVQSTQVVSRGTSTMGMVIYTGHPAATTLGELTYYGGPTGTQEYLDVVAGQTYYFNFVVTDSDEERPQFGRPVPWHVVLRISSYGFYTDWIDPPAGTIAFYHGDAQGTTDNHATPDSPNDVGFGVTPPASWNTSTKNYATADGHVIVTGNQHLGIFSVNPSGVPPAAPGDDPGPDYGNYVRAWNEALRCEQGSTTYGTATYSSTGTRLSLSSHGVEGRVGWYFAHGPDTPVGYYGGVSCYVWIRSVRVSLITALSLMGPCGTYDLDQTFTELYDAGYSLDPGGPEGLVVYENDLPELLAVDMSPDEAVPPQPIAQGDTRGLDVVEWRCSLAGGGNGWGPLFLIGDPLSSGTWQDGMGGPADYAGRSDFLTFYDGGNIGWFAVPEEMWRTALANELPYWRARSAANAVEPWRGCTGLEFVCLPYDVLNGECGIDYTLGSGKSESGGRSSQTICVRLTVKPSRFKVALRPNLEDATPTYPEDIPVTGATGDGRRTFGRPESPQVL